MDKEIIYRVFKGRASSAEIAIVRQWVESNPHNREEYMRERALFDAIQLSDLQTPLHLSICFLRSRTWSGWQLLPALYCRQPVLLISKA